MSKSPVCLLIDEVINDIYNWTPKSHRNDKQKPQKQPIKKKKMKVYNPPYNEEYFDTHCHLDWLLNDKFECKVSDFPTIYNEYFNGNFGGALTIACWPEQYKPVSELIYSQNEANKKIYGSFGIHPRIANQWNDKIKQQIIDLVKADSSKKQKKIIAVGECGLDYSDLNHNAAKDIQQQTFIEQIKLSVELNLPLVVHSRQAENDTIDIMRKNCPRDKFIHLHCVTDSLKFAHNMLDYFPNLLVGFTGVISFKKNNELRNTVKNIPLNRILLETDSPFFTSAIHPGTIGKIAKKVAEIHGVKDVNQVLKQCRINTRQLYGV